MDICGDILQNGEIKNDEFNDEIYDLVLQEFLSSVEDTFSFNNDLTPGEKVRGLKDQYIYTSKYAKLFFEILSKHNYNMRQEIKDAMFSLGHLENPSKNKDVIKRLLGSPIIQDISFNGKDKFTISSEKYGDLVMELASYYYRTNQRITDYMKNNPLPNRCHVHAYFMSKVFTDFYAITSLCLYYFRDTYHHSYTYDKDKNVIIDLCYNGIIDKNQYYDIFLPQDISVILNSKVADELLLTSLKTEQYLDRCHLLKIALYKQYLSSIGYHGNLETAPSIKSI